MKNTFVSLAAIAGIAAAQQLNVAMVDSAPLPATTAAPVAASQQSVEAYNAQSAGSSISDSVQPTSAPQSPSKRDGGNCAPQPQGTGPQARPDTDVGFENYPLWSAEANNAAPPPPYIEKFRNLNGSTQQNSYLTYYILANYDVNRCAQYCNNNNLCSAFNIYVERDPSLDPGSNCPNPPSVSNYKCALWGSSISRSTATNTGQYRQNFHVVIAGSNGYDKTLFQQAEQVSGFDAAVNITKQAITKAQAYYLGSEFFAGPYDATLCGYYATAQTAANKQYAQANGLKTYQAANSFNAYYVYKNEFAWGTYCNLYKQDVDASYAGSADTTSGGDSYTVGSSWVYNADPQDPGTF